MSTTVEDKKKRGLRSFFKKKKLEETGAKTAAVAAAKATELKTPAKPAARSVAEADATPKISNVKPKADDTTDTRGSWLSRTKYFRNLSNWAFDVVDTDGSGSVDEKELYAGLLLIHLKLGSYAGPAACKVGSNEITFARTDHLQLNICTLRPHCCSLSSATVSTRSF